MYQYRDVVQDKQGNALYNASIQVLNYQSGLPQPIFSDFAGTQPIASSIVYTDVTGAYRFFLAPDVVTLVITYLGVTITVSGISIPLGPGNGPSVQSPLRKEFNIAVDGPTNFLMPVGAVTIFDVYVDGRLMLLASYSFDLPSRVLTVPNVTHNTTLIARYLTA